MILLVPTSFQYHLGLTYRQFPDSYSLSLLYRNCLRIRRMLKEKIPREKNTAQKVCSQRYGSVMMATFRIVDQHSAVGKVITS